METRATDSQEMPQTALEATQRVGLSVGELARDRIRLRARTDRAIGSCIGEEHGRTIIANSRPNHEIHADETG